MAIEYLFLYRSHFYRLCDDDDERVRFLSKLIWSYFSRSLSEHTWSHKHSVQILETVSVIKNCIGRPEYRFVLFYSLFHSRSFPYVHCQAVFYRRTHVYFSKLTKKTTSAERTTTTKNNIPRTTKCFPFVCLFIYFCSVFFLLFSFLFSLFVLLNENKRNKNIFISFAFHFLIH